MSSIGSLKSYYRNQYIYQLAELDEEEIQQAVNKINDGEAKSVRQAFEVEPVNKRKKSVKLKITPPVKKRLDNIIKNYPKKYNTRRSYAEAISFLWLYAGLPDISEEDI